ncbi:MAG TPA: hypothetical protein VGG40_03060 [Solirubrobacterales bacterium]
MKKLLVLGLAIAAIAVTGALTASAASAAVGEFDFACNIDTECFVNGEQKTENVFTVNGGVVKCTKAVFSGKSTAAEGGTTVTTKGTTNHDWAIHILKIHPEYTGCTFIGQTAEVTTTGCFYTLSVTVSVTINQWSGSVTISCEGTNVITVKAVTAGCTVKVGPQTPANNVVDFTKEEAGGLKDILVTSTVGTETHAAGHTGIVYTSSGGACGASGENGYYRGTVTEKAYSDSAHTKQVSGTIVETVSATEIVE